MKVTLREDLGGKWNKVPFSGGGSRGWIPRIPGGAAKFRKRGGHPIEKNP